MKKSWISLSLLLLPQLLLSCDVFDPVPEGRIRIKNDSQDREYNLLNVYAGGVSFTLKPGEAKLIPAQTSSISFRREYKEYTRSYEVQCPPINGSGITIKLLDVHLNRISGGCKTVSADKF